MRIGSECIWTVFILTGLTSVSDCQVMAVIGFGFEVFLYNNQRASSQKSLWFVLTYWWLDIIRDFPSYPFYCPAAQVSFLDESYQKKVPNWKESDPGTFRCSWKHLWLQCGLSAGGAWWRPSELSLREGQPCSHCGPSHKQAPHAPFWQMAGKSYSFPTILHETPLGAALQVGQVLPGFSPFSVAHSDAESGFLQTTLRIQFLRCSKGKLISAKYLIIYKVGRGICLSFYICIWNNNLANAEFTEAKTK